MNHKKLSTLLIIWLFVYPQQAHAEWGSSAAASSKYLIQGVVSAEGTPVPHLALHYSWDDVLQTGVSSTRSDYLGFRKLRKAATELDYFINYTLLPHPDWQANINFTHYAYHGRKIYHTYNYNELRFSGLYKNKLQMSIGLAKNLFRKNEINQAFEVSFNQNLPGQWIIYTGLGYNNSDSKIDVDYHYWNINLSRSYKQWILDAGYYQAGDNAQRYFGNHRANGNIAVTVTFQF